MTLSALSHSERARIVVAFFFFRSLDLEGGSALIRGIVKAMLRQGFELTLLLPPSPIDLPSEVRVETYEGNNPLARLRHYVRRLRELRSAADGVLMHDNSPVQHFVLGWRLGHGDTAATHFGSPLAKSRILRRGLRRQYLTHWIGKSFFLARILARLVGFRAARYVVSSEYQARQLESLGCPGEKILVSPFGAAPVERPSPTSPSGSPAREERSVRPLTLGYLGHFSPIKGVPDLIRALERLLQNGVNVRLRIAWSGKGADEKLVYKLLRKPLLHRSVTLEGRVDPASFLGDVDLTVLPFRSESLPHPPLVLLESWAVDVPVVTTNVGGLPEFVQAVDGGWTVPPARPDLLAETLAKLAHDRKDVDLKRHGLAARSLERFSTERMCKEIAESAGWRPRESHTPSESDHEEAWA